MDCMRASRAWIGNESTQDGDVQATKARGPSGESARANGARVDAVSYTHLTLPTTPYV